MSPAARRKLLPARRKTGEGGSKLKKVGPIPAVKTPHERRPPDEPGATRNDRPRRPLLPLGVADPLYHAAPPPPEKKCEIMRSLGFKVDQGWARTSCLESAKSTAATSGARPEIQGPVMMSRPPPSWLT